MWHTNFLINIYKKKICLQKKNYILFPLLLHQICSAWRVTKGLRWWWPHNFFCDNKSKKLGLVTFSYNCHMGTWSLEHQTCWWRHCYMSLPDNSLNAQGSVASPQVQRGSSHKSDFVGSEGSKWMRKTRILDQLKKLESDNQMHLSSFYLSLCSHHCNPGLSHCSNRL